MESGQVIMFRQATAAARSRARQRRMPRGCSRHPAWSGLSMVKRLLRRAETDRWIGFVTGGPLTNMSLLAVRCGFFKAARLRPPERQDDHETEQVRVPPALPTRDRDRFRRRAFRHRPGIDGGSAALAQARSDGRNASTVPRPPAFRLRRSRWGAFVERFADHVSAKKSLVGQWSSRGLHGRNGQRSHLTLRFSADVLPRLLTSSYSTC